MGERGGWVAAAACHDCAAGRRAATLHLAYPFKVSHSLHLGLSPAATSLPLSYFPFPTSTPPHPTTLLVIQGLLDSLRAGGVEARLVPFPALPEGATRTSLYSFWKVSLDVSFRFINRWVVVFTGAFCHTICPVLLECVCGSEGWVKVSERLLRNLSLKKVAAAKDGAKGLGC